MFVDQISTRMASTMYTLDLDKRSEQRVGQPLTHYVSKNHFPAIKTTPVQIKRINNNLSAQQIARPASQEKANYAASHQDGIP